MKIFLKFISVMLILFGFTNCANGRKLQEESPVDVKPAYYTTWDAGVKGAGSGINFFIPTQGDDKIVLDSVYFRGRKAALQKEPSQPGLYVAQFRIPSSEDKRDIIMHVDPKKEYGNPPPVIPQEMPFKLEKDEAAVRYMVNGRTKYFKLKAVVKKEDDSTEIKKPENIRH
ncbi:MAG: hypothetical protein WBL21_12505 [Salinimicrobium sp.]